MYSPHASAASSRALVNSDTVSGGSSSTEARLAQASGFSVDVVNGATWDAMTQTQFAQYQVLIAGDPYCGAIAGSLVSNESTWAPVVMGRAVNTKPGNRVLVGTDPVDHSGGYGPRTTVISDGIDFAGSQPGRTGIYLDSSCGGNYYGQRGLAAAMMKQLSSGSGTWTEDDNPPCGGNVAKIASTPKFDSLTTADLAGWGCSVHESFPTFASDWSALAVATDTASHPTCGTDNTVSPPVTACGEAYVLIAGSGIVVVAPNITVTPATGTDPAGASHTVTANVIQSGSAVTGQLVTFTVTGQNNGTTGTCAPVTCATDGSGNVSFTYTDGAGAGDDTILASFADASGTTQQASAAEHWVAASESPITVSGTTFTSTEGDAYTGLTAAFTDPDPTATPGEYSATINWGDGSPATTGTVTGPTGGPFTVNGSHTYSEEGNYTVSVTITDTDAPANSATASSHATVVDAALAPAPAKTISTTEGAAFTGTVAGFTDANPTATIEDFTASINWGDGSPATTGTVTGPTGGPFTINGSHTYTDEGSYSIKTAVTDKGGSTATPEGNATVADAALTGAGTNSTMAQNFNGAVATFADADTTTSSPADFTATIDWGDGTATSAGTVSGGNGSYTVNGSHSFAGTGFFTVKTHIADDGGSIADTTSQVLIYGTVAGGNFVIGDQNTAMASTVTFWGAKWSQQNTLTSGPTPASFKGFENNPVTTLRGTNWTTDPGNSTPPPSGALPAYMAVVVSDTITQSGKSITGNDIHIVVVRTNNGYDPDPGHSGTGTIVGIIS
ncbi:MAG TPA: hypothetical protein VIM40_00315 [Arthrobacter sp.]|jgi:hypothetical protein